MLPCFKEIVVEKNINLGMEALSATMSEKGFSWTFSTNVLGCKVGKFIWKLANGLTQKASNEVSSSLTFWK